MIKLKSPEEIKILGEGGEKLANTLQTLKKECREGVSTAYIDECALKLIKKIGGTPSFKGFKNYPANICVSINDEIVHGIPSKRRFKRGDLVSLDLGLVYKGLYTDAAITIVIDAYPNFLQRKLIKITQKALDLGIKEIKIGKNLGQVSAKIGEVVARAKFKVFPTLVGHGVGYAVHEKPPIPNFGEKNSGPEIKEGMVLAIEPMVSAGADKIKIDENGWTAKTSDGALSCHFEHTVAVINSGIKILTLPPRRSAGWRKRRVALEKKSRYW